MVLGLSPLFADVIWLRSIFIIITYLPPFIVFVQMMRHNDSAESRLRLYNHYKIWMIFVGLPLVLIFGLYIIYRWEDFLVVYCSYADRRSESNFYDGAKLNCLESTSKPGIIIGQLIEIAIYLPFRIYLAGVMKKYALEGTTTENE